MPATPSASSTVRRHLPRGLGRHLPRHLPQQRAVETPLRALVNSGKLEAEESAFFLGTGGAAGELVLGGADTGRYIGGYSRRGHRSELQGLLLGELKQDARRQH